MSAILSAFLASGATGQDDPPKKPPPSKRLLGIFRSDFDTADKILLGASTLALAGDWLTTVDAVRRRNEGYEERNAILGRHPSVGRVNTYTAGVGLANALIASQLPPKLRKVWLGGFTAMELAAMLHNKSGGLRFNFKI